MLDPMPTQDPTGQQLRDLELMRRVARRDPAAQRELAGRLVNRVRRLSRLLLREPAEAEDAAQLALMEILQSASGFRHAGSIEAWADRITARTTLRLARELRARRTILQRLSELGPNLDALPGMHVRPPQNFGIDAFLKRLNTPRREAFVLKYALGYSVEEISELTGAAIGTVKDRIAIARRQLRRMVERDTPRPGLGGHS